MKFRIYTLAFGLALSAHAAEAQKTKVDSLVSKYLNDYNRMVTLQTQARYFLEDIEAGEKCVYKYNEIGSIANYLNVEAIKLVASAKADNTMNDGTLKQIIEAVEEMRPTIKNMQKDFPEIKRGEAAAFDQLLVQGNKAGINNIIRAQNEAFAELRKLNDANADRSTLSAVTNKLVAQVEADSATIRKMCEVETVERINGARACTRNLQILRNFKADLAKPASIDPGEMIQQRVKLMKEQNAILSKMNQEAESILAGLNKNPRDPALPPRFDKFVKEFSAMRQKIEAQNMPDEDKAAPLKMIRETTSIIQKISDILKKQR